MLLEQNKYKRRVDMDETKARSREKAGLTRRTMLQTAAGAALGMAVATATPAVPAPPPIYYGKVAGRTPLDEKNLFPLLTAWLLLTTNGPAETIDAAKIAAVANIDPKNVVDTLLAKYTDKRFASSFSKVRMAFSEVAKEFANAQPYSGGQCPESAARVAPIASLPCAK
jgi:hypothetical protein